MKQIFTLASIILFLQLTCFGQRRDSPFQAGLTIGLNAAQINGDDYSGYRKFGIQGGLQGIVNFTDNFFVSFELLYSQRGARPNEEEKLNYFGNHVNIRLNYIEIPILLNGSLTDKTKQKEARRKGFFPTRIFGGVSIGRLISTDIESIGRNNQPYPLSDLGEFEEEFTRFDISFIFGLQHNFTKSIGVFAKHTFSIRQLYQLTNARGVLTGLNPYHLTVGTSYLLF